MNNDNPASYDHHKPCANEIDLIRPAQSLRLDSFRMVLVAEWMEALIKES